MYENAFDIVALAMRYWFVLIVVYILIRLIQNVMLEFSSERTAQKRAAGYALGLLEVVEPVNSPLFGHTFALKRENTIGSARKCDIRLKAKTVNPLHAAVYQKGNKVFLSDYGSKQGVLLNGRRIKRDVPLIGDDEIALGSMILLLHLSGIEETQRNDSYYYDDEESQEYLDVTEYASSTGNVENGGEYEDEENDDYGDEYDDDDAAADDEYEDDKDSNFDHEPNDDDDLQFDGDDEIVFRNETVNKNENQPNKWKPYDNKRGREDPW